MLSAHHVLIFLFGHRYVCSTTPVASSVICPMLFFDIVVDCEMRTRGCILIKSVVLTAMISDVYVDNKPGTVYMATLTGPVHQAVHSPDDEPCLRVNGLGRLSVAFQLRCALFPAGRARTSNATPCPQAFFSILADSLTRWLTTCSFRGPSLAECKCFLEDEPEQADEHEKAGSPRAPPHEAPQDRVSTLT